ncbi:P1 family peptidase [Miltoncostaea marina]|uniref:P1 family peptidase n=1 Tax=Miltoncostaea marina TaxID=2843215 RepID=UPI001C3C35B9|nr:P1 family peptidase [Miltoncostaea marina]
MSEVEGVAVGHWTDAGAATGCTVVIPPPGTVGAVEVRGGGPATRDVAILESPSSSAAVSALVFSGGSAFGLDVAGGVARWCEERGLGHDTGAARVPIVPTACIYDLGISGNTRRPGADEGYAACEAARPGPHAVGSVGAGAGATCGKLLAQAGWCKGGLGAGARRLHDGATVAALVVVNAWGDVLDERGEVLAGAWQDGRGFVRAADRVIDSPPVHPRLAAGANTTLACVVTDARLTRAEATGVVRMAHTGMARAVSPAHTVLDGDVAFCLATGARAASAFACGVAAAEAVADAIRDAVRSATSLRGVPTGADRRAAGLG